jgi:hypothetical protein
MSGSIANGPVPALSVYTTVSNIEPLVLREALR